MSRQMTVVILYISCASIHILSRQMSLHFVCSDNLFNCKSPIEYNMYNSLVCSLHNPMNFVLRIIMFKHEDYAKPRIMHLVCLLQDAFAYHKHAYFPNAYTCFGNMNDGKSLNHLYLCLMQNDKLHEIDQNLNLFNHAKGTRDICIVMNFCENPYQLILCKNFIDDLLLGLKTSF